LIYDNAVPSQTTGEISAHFSEIYGASVSKETVSRITDKVIEEMQSWQQRPLDEIYAAVFIDAIVVKILWGSRTRSLALTWSSRRPARIR
jgi:transposase-like protein